MNAFFTAYMKELRVAVREVPREIFAPIVGLYRALGAGGRAFIETLHHAYDVHQERPTDTIR